MMKNWDVRSTFNYFLFKRTLEFKEDWLAMTFSFDLKPSKTFLKKYFISLFSLAENYKYDIFTKPNYVIFQNFIKPKTMFLNFGLYVFISSSYEKIK